MKKTILFEIYILYLIFKSEEGGSLLVNTRYYISSQQKYCHITLDIT